MSKKAFTLMEVLLAAVIGSIVLLTVYKSYQTTLDVYRGVDQSVVVDAVSIQGQLGRELRSAFLSRDEQTGTNFFGNKTSLTFVSTVPLTEKFDGTKEFDLVSRHYFLTSSTVPGLQALKYYPTAFQPQSQTTQERQERTVAQRIKSLSFEYFDGALWKESWNSDKELPRAVKVNVTFEQKTGRKTEQSFSTVIQLLAV